MQDLQQTTVQIWKSNQTRKLPRAQGGEGGIEFDKMDPTIFECSVNI
jgi:hypothetical protein|eukprot:COSAG06_NODE_1204_length_10277_cov_21.330517_3_plen_47_part_00